MIEQTHGDILNADAEALVNSVNCVGVMGRGIALQFKKAFPENYNLYKDVCDKNLLHPGKMLVHDMGRFENPRYIVNFPTKRHWKGKSRIEDIESGLEALIDVIKQYKIKSVAIPPLGSGLGGLNWQEVRLLIEKAFHDLTDIHILLYEPKGAPVPQEMVIEKKVPKMTVGRASLLGLVRRYLAAVMDPAVSLLEIHKLMYFMQVAGENLRLNYRKAQYGPYAENLRHVLNIIEGHYITGFGDAADIPGRQIELIPKAAEEADKFLQDYPETIERLDRVSKLIEGFETPYGMELLSTVHWVVNREQADTREKAITKVKEWNIRKRLFQEKHLNITWDVLVAQNWINT